MSQQKSFRYRLVSSGERGDPFYLPWVLAAKQALRLEKELHKLDGFAAIIVDDIGYLQQSRAEMEVLFTLLAERCERKSGLDF